MVRSFAAYAFATALTGAAAHSPALVYKFDAADAAGVDGSIQVVYAGEDSSTATITAALDFSAVDQAKLAAFDGNCTEAVTSYKWHIHTKWNSTLSSDSFKQCSKAATDNHYDPLRACGTASEYIAEPECKAKSLTYACNPANYTADPWCARRETYRAKTPRIACAVGQEAEHEYEDESEDGSETEHEAGSQEQREDEYKTSSEEQEQEQEQEQEEYGEGSDEHEHHEEEDGEASGVDGSEEQYGEDSEEHQEASGDETQHEHDEQEGEEEYGEQTTGDAYDDEHKLCA
ncbi:uncharacterized protein KRP23_12661 [Phytophthora ramorum]|uniref:uncharacterized protein n=1 Tax=Phytophthora ramorum TaxID=164328 RepID=UPI0030A9B3E5|nr:hypothetical protein KRP23_12661 [Phytophthora ramorum]